jgi:hypothetical protein
MSFIMGCISNSYVDITTSICSFNFSYFNFIFNDISLMKDKESMLTLVKKIDSANGYVFGGKHEEGNLSEMLSHAAGADFEYFKYPFTKLCSFAYLNGCHNTACTACFIRWY